MVQVCSILVSKWYLKILIVILLFFLSSVLYFPSKRRCRLPYLPWLLGFGSGHFYIGNDLGGSLCCISELAALGIAGFIYMEYVWRPKQ